MIKTFTRSFAGGEITEEMAARVDLIKNQTGLALCCNFKVLPHGPIENRAGFEYVIETKFSDRESVLIPFLFSNQQAYALEFGDAYMRIHVNGGVLLNSAQSIASATNASPGVFTKNAHGYTNGRWLYFSDVVGMDQLGGRFMIVTDVTTNTFRLTDLAGVAFDTTALGAFVSGNMAPVYEIVTPYADEHLADIHYTQSADVLTLVHPTYPVQEVKRLGATNWTITSPTFAPTISAPAAPTVTVGAGSGSIDYEYVTTAIAADGLEESLASPSDSVTNNLAGAGAFNTIVTATVAGAVRYNVYRLISGLYGYIGQTDGGDFTDDNILPDTSKTPPLNDDPFT